MEYTILKLAHLAGISTRTLRYYDEIDLLKPARMSSSGYRIYSQKEVDQLQQILFYKEFGGGLDEIKQIINNPQIDDMQAIQDQYQKLLEKRKQIADHRRRNADEPAAHTAELRGGYAALPGPAHPRRLSQGA